MVGKKNGLKLERKQLKNPKQIEFFAPNLKFRISWSKILVGYGGMGGGVYS